MMPRQRLSDEERKARTVSEATINRHVKAAIDAIPGAYIEKRWGNPYEGPGKADFTGVIRVLLYKHVDGTVQAVTKQHRIEPVYEIGWRFEIEAKRVGKDGRKAQYLRMRKWQQRGALTGVAHSVAEVVAILAPALRMRGDFAEICRKLKLEQSVIAGIEHDMASGSDRGE